MFKGSMVALVTPMLDDGSIDYQTLYDLVEWHIASQTQALIVAGTTGESATLDPQEQVDLISSVVKQVAGRIPVIAGTGTNATRSTLKLTRNAMQAGVEACLIVTPYYNKPTQEGLYQHFKQVAEVDCPIILYNVPARTACDLQPETVEKLSALPNIIGIKEATGKLDRALDIRKRCGSAFGIYSGDDATAMDLMLAGAQGVISVTANVAPQQMQEMCEAALSGQHEKAKQLNAALMPLHTQLFVESNPIPAKWALYTMGKIPSGIRLPLLPLNQRYHQIVKNAMQHAGVI